MEISPYLLSMHYLYLSSTVAVISGELGRTHLVATLSRSLIILELCLSVEGFLHLILE